MLVSVYLGSFSEREVILIENIHREKKMKILLRAKKKNYSSRLLTNRSQCLGFLCEIEVKIRGVLKIKSLFFFFLNFIVARYVFQTIYLRFKVRMLSHIVEVESIVFCCLVLYLMQTRCFSTLVQFKIICVRNWAGLTQRINHGPWIVHMGYLISKFKFKLTDIDISC